MTPEEIAEVWQGPVRALARRYHRKYPTIELGDIEGEAWLRIFETGYDNPRKQRSFLGKHLDQVLAKELDARRRADQPSPADTRWSESQFKILLTVALRPETAETARPEWRNTLERLAGIVGDLPLADQELLVGKFGQGATGAELARDCGVSEMTISRRLRSLVEKVQDALEGVDPDREYVGGAVIPSLNMVRFRINENEPIRTKARRHGKAKVEE